MVVLSQQEAWTRWENALQREITWTDYWQADIHRIRLLVLAVYDTLPSPANLHTCRVKHLPALNALREDPSSTSSATAIQPWPTDATIGAMTR